MDNINPITGNKRRLPNFATAQNKRSMALAAHDRMLIRRAEDEAEECAKALIVSLLYLMTCMAAFYNDLFEEDVTILILQALVQLSGGVSGRF